MLDTKKLTPHQEIDYIFRQLLPDNGMGVREAQIALCHTMLDAMSKKRIALCDAGVGIGKTFAYLVAGTIYYKCRLTFRPILISTASIALQNAVLNEYIPFLSDILIRDGVIDQPLKAVLRKGKSHYVCDERLRRRMAGVNLEQKNPAARQALLSLRYRLDMDGTARLTDYDKRQVCVPPVCDCLNTLCRYQEYVRESRSPEYLFQVCNHNFMIADAMQRRDGIPSLMPECCAVIIDEAHKLPEAARQMFSKSLSLVDITEFLNGLRKEKFILACERLSKTLRPIIRYLKEIDESDGEAGAITLNAQDMTAAEKMLLSIRKTLGPVISPPLRGELMDILEFCSLFKSKDRRYIFYAGKDGQSRAALTAAITDHTEMLRNTLWCGSTPAVLTSGTLAVGNDFSRFRDDAGLKFLSELTVESVSLSPFDYQKNCLLHIPKTPVFRPDNADGYYDKISDIIGKLIKITNGHTLLLFNSYAAMTAVFERLKVGGMDIPAFVMKRNHPVILSSFRESGNGVLFATGSAWEGMDFPGDIVSSLVIVRLPFAVPDPITECKKQKYPSLKAFIKAVAVPDMQIKLKQGCGRAIRTETDTCVISILDERCQSGRRFHKAVLDALPPMRMTESLREVDAFINEVKPASFFAGGIYSNG